MEIIDYSLSHLRNDEHHEFHADFSELVTRFTPDALGIQALVATYNDLFLAEGDTLNIIKKNDLTDELFNADLGRDTTLRGFNATIKSACNHFDAEKQKAGGRIQIVLDEFGNIAAKSYEAETTSINSLVLKLTRDYANDVALLGVNDWLDELLNRNAAFTAISNQRYTKETAKTQLRMKEVRIELDDAYKAIVKRINALVEINGPAAHSDFIKELNLRIEKYMSKRTSRKASAASDKPTTEVSEAK